MMQEIPMSGTGSVLLMVVLILLFLLGALPILYYHGGWGMEDDDEWEWDGSTWVKAPPEPPPTICTFYSAGMKVAIDEILKPAINIIEIGTKSTEIDVEPLKNTQNS